jgi:hypothetical protein
MAFTILIINKKKEYSGIIKILKSKMNAFLCHSAPPRALREKTCERSEQQIYSHFPCRRAQLNIIPCLVLITLPSPVTAVIKTTPRFEKYIRYTHQQFY